jgi:hypothetical protein
MNIADEFRYAFGIHFILTQRAAENLHKAHKELSTQRALTLLMPEIPQVFSL